MRHKYGASVSVCVLLLLRAAFCAFAAPIGIWYVCVCVFTFSYLPAVLLILSIWSHGPAHHPSVLCPLWRLQRQPRAKKTMQRKNVHKYTQTRELNAKFQHARACSLHTIHNTNIFLLLRIEWLLGLVWRFIPRAQMNRQFYRQILFALFCAVHNRHGQRYIDYRISRTTPLLNTTFFIQIETGSNSNICILYMHILPVAAVNICTLIIWFERGSLNSDLGAMQFIKQQ